MHIASATELFDQFAADLAGMDRIARLRDGVIGEGMMIPGLNAPQKLVYAQFPFI